VNIYEGDSPVIFGVPYEDILSGDVTEVLTALQGFLQSHNSVLSGRGRITLLFEGYDDDPRDVYDIPEIRSYTRTLDPQQA